MIETEINIKAFAEARSRALGDMPLTGGFGTLAERSLHRIIKLYIEPDISCHEVEYMGSICDIKNSQGIFEVQTQALGRLKTKLEHFLDESRVTVIYPIAQKKKLIRISDTGQTKITASPKHGRIHDAIYELYNIRELLNHPRLDVCLMLLDVDEFYGKGEIKKIGRRSRRVAKIECIPNSICEIINFTSPESYLALLPEGLPEQFSASDINRLIGRRFKWGYSLLAILSALGLLTEPILIGRRKCYEILPEYKNKTD